MNFPAIHIDNYSANPLMARLFLSLKKQIIFVVVTHLFIVYIDLKSIFLA